jgi:hypothetical protein
LIDAVFFSGHDAKERAIRYAEREYGAFNEVDLRPYRRAPDLAKGSRTICRGAT